MSKVKAVEIAARLEKYPHLLERIDALLNITENISGDLRRADDAEKDL